MNSGEIHSEPITISKMTPPIFLGVAKPKNKVTKRTTAAQSHPHPNSTNAWEFCVAITKREMPTKNPP